MNPIYYAHSANTFGFWHPLPEHLQCVSRMTGEFAEGFPWPDEARLAGLLHDLGKYGDRFQNRLHGNDQGLDHWSQGAWLALSQYHAIAAGLAIQGHHIGLQYLSADHLRGLLNQHKSLQLELSGDWKIVKDRLAGDGLSPITPTHIIVKGELVSRLDNMLDVRMLYSTLVDADFLDTEAHFNGNEQGKVYRNPSPQLQAGEALAILLKQIERLGQQTEAAETVAHVRQTLRNDCLEAAQKETGLFTLTAPTGSGKTLAMLAFALAHAQKHALRRVVMVIPYLSIIEQTARIYREIFEPHFGPDYVLEHHSLAGRGSEQQKADNEGGIDSEQAAERRRRLLSENWDAPLVVTTSVQALESLFSNRSSACRKLHRLGRSVILFDEVQTLPPSLAVPTLAALSHLAHAYGSSVVFSTATQPAFEHLHEAVTKHASKGWQPRPIVPDPSKLFEPMQRVKVQWPNPGETLAWPELAGRLKEKSQTLCIVNLKKHAQALWEAMDDDDVFHLSTNLCAAHRQDVLDSVRNRLKNKQPVHLVATQCVEAGVDVDFPVVWRALGPLDAIIQAAGRCNREGRLATGQVSVFIPEDEAYPPGVYQQAAVVTRNWLSWLRKHGSEEMKLDVPEFITAYYRDFYAINRPEISESTRQIEKYIQDGAFPKIACEYRLIDQDTINVVVPYAPCLELFQQLQDTAEVEGLTPKWIKQARPLAVSVYRPKKTDDPIWDSLIPVQSKRQRGKKSLDDWFMAAGPKHYHPALGYQPPKGFNVWIG